ncbi:MAG: substrate-binding domain-containing protein [Pseudomonadota bacterium]
MHLSSVFARLTLIFVVGLGQALAEDLYIVGSSTVHPFSETTADHLPDDINVRIELTGTNGGILLFCNSATGAPDIANASRALRPDEREYCQSKGVTQIDEYRFGYDGVVVATGNKSRLTSLTTKQLFLALAEKIPAGDGSCRLIKNPNRKWRDLSPALPNVPIEVYGPPLTSGTRDAFIDLAIAAGARQLPCLNALSVDDPNTFRYLVESLRVDGAWIDAGENDHAIASTVKASRTGLGIFGFATLLSAQGSLRAIEIDGVEPARTTISDTTYPLARPLYFYANMGRPERMSQIRRFVRESFSEDAQGSEGYLAQKGLVPLSETELETIRTRISDRQSAIVD